MYDSSTLTRLDVQSAHNTQIRHQHPLQILTKLPGISEEEVQSIMSAPTLISTSGDAFLPPAIIAFSPQPSQTPDPSGGNFTGGDFATSIKRNQISSCVVDLATRVFQANSIAVSHHALTQLQVWQKVLGWELRAAIEGSIPAAPTKPIAAATTRAAKEGEGGRSGSGRAAPKKANNVVLVAAPPSEAEYHGQPRPKDLSVLALAHEVFIVPAITAQQQAEGGPNVVSSHLPDSLSALGLSSWDSSTSSSHPSLSSGFGVPSSHKFPALSLGSSSASRSSSQPSSSPGLGAPRVASPFSSISPAPCSLPLISPQVILWYLPTHPWTRAFMDEFDSLMITHDGIGASGEHSILKKRLESMFEWADLSMKRSGSADGEPADNQRTGSIPRGMGGGGSTQEEPKPLPPTPTLGLFAVACAVYALGGLSYGSKSVHGTFPDDGGNTPEPSAYPPGVLLNPHLHPLPDKATPSNLFNLARAALLVHDESALPPSLDYIHAHILTWLYLLHPSDSASTVTSRGFRGSSTGIGSGGMTVVERTIYKDLAKCVSVAREMGLDLVDRASEKLKGAAFGFWRKEDRSSGEEGMGIWEKEMRRRVWWQLMMFDQQISDNLGRPPLIPPGTYACKPPSAADESMFGPTATAIPNPLERAKDLTTTHFATKCQLLSIIKPLYYAQLEQGLTSDLANQFDARVSNWRSSLPGQYNIDFQENPEDTLFPKLDTVAIQACDLHIMANVFLLRLWLPFFNEALSNSSQSSEGVLLTATNAANAVITASHHLVTRFRDARPMGFGHYDFGNSVWLATGILASVVTMKPDVIFSSTARRGVEIAGAVFRNQVVEGKSDPDHVPRYEVNNIMSRIERIVAQVPMGKLSSVAHHKSGTDLSEMRCNVPIPYVGTAAITTTTETSVLLAQNKSPLVLAFGARRNLRYQESDGTSSDSVLLTPPYPEVYLDPLPGSQPPMEEESVVASALPAGVPPFRTSDPPNRMSASQSSMSQKRILPVNRIWRRLSLAAHATPTSSVYVPPLPNHSRVDGTALDVSSVDEPFSSDSPHNPSYPMIPREPEGYPITAPPNQPPSIHPPPIHQSRARTWLTNIQTTGGLSVSRQAESYGPASSGSHLSAQENPREFEIGNMLPISEDKSFDTRAANPPHLPSVIQQQYGSHSGIDGPEPYTVDSFPEVTWCDVPAP
ncbi:hypothetical protein FRC01_012199 [Tulasnella sp. 417]|nr:hypothetical protein FRC01_012199 [Tulasnella sp. 417]